MTTSDTPAAPPVVSGQAIADLHERLDRYRPVVVPRDLETGAGIDRRWLDTLLDHWRNGYDWREHEARIRSLPWQLVDGATPLRVVHQRVSPDAPTVVLLHGWPDSVLRFERLLPLLGEFNVVVPALPGYPFSAPTTVGGMAASGHADAVVAAMAALGYDRFVLSAGDVGSDVAETIIRNHGDRVAAHLTDVSQVHFFGGLPDDLTAEEQAYVQRGRAWQAAEGGYSHEHSTKPATLAVGLGDSAGLLAWIGEKLSSWTDHDDDISTVFDLDEEALTWVSAYWFTGSIGTSLAPYALKTTMPNVRADAEAPVVMTIFPKDLANAPRSFAERLFDVRAYDVHAKGGHFAAWEQPELYARGVRAAVAAAR